MSDDAVVSGIIPKAELQQFVDTHTPLVSEGRVHFSDTGLRTSVVDPANIAMVEECHLDRALFEAYDAPGQVTIGVDFTRFDEILDAADSDQLIDMSVNMETRKLELTFGNVEQSMRLIDPESMRNEPNDPGLELDNSATITGKQLDEALTIADLNSDHVAIRGRPDDRELVFFAQGDTDNGRVAYSDDDVVDAKLSDDDTESLFSLSYMEELSDPIPKDAEVELRFTHEHPLRLRWEACDGYMSVQQMVAPRIQSN